MLAACSAISIASAAALLNVLATETEHDSHKRKQRVSVWVRKYLFARPQYGAFNSLMPDLLELDQTKFRHGIKRMPVSGCNASTCSQQIAQVQFEFYGASERATAAVEVYRTDGAAE